MTRSHGCETRTGDIIARIEMAHKSLGATEIQKTNLDTHCFHISGQPRAESIQKIRTKYNWLEIHKCLSRWMEEKKGNIVAIDFSRIKGKHSIACRH